MRVSIPGLAVMGAVGLLLALLTLSGTVSAQETRYNVYTVDRHMPNFGDIVSNWVAARHPAIREGVEVNLYVAPIHHEKFRTILLMSIEPRHEIVWVNERATLLAAEG